jgi:hypothetical protein
MDEKQLSGEINQNEKNSTTETVEDASHSSVELDKPDIDLQAREINAKLANPLAGRSHERLMTEGEAFARKFDLQDLTDEFRKGAVVAQDPLGFESLSMLSEDDKASLRREIEHKWDQPLRLYLLVICCSVAAAVQGVSFPLVYALLS